MRLRPLAIVFLASVTLISLELTWTRLFSAEFFYTFAFLTLSLAVLGLGLGGLALRLFATSGRGNVAAVSLSLAGLMAVVGPPVVVRLGLDFPRLLTSWAMVAKLAAALAILSSAFFFGGIALAAVFRSNSGDMPRVYMADLLGAGLGVVAGIAAMNALGTQYAVFWVALPALLAGLLAATRLWARAVALVVMALAIVGAGNARALLDSGTPDRAPVVYEHWDAMAKVKMYSFGGQYRGLNIDNVANTPVIPFDGDWAALAADSEGVHWDIDVGYLVGRFDDCRFLSLGAGGGADAFQALEQGATEVHAVEVIPHINRMMLDGDPDGYTVLDSTVTDSTGRLITLPEYTGRLYHDPRVTVVSEDARTYVRRYREGFDIIFSLSSNTWAALGSGSFALAENYLFTAEAFADYWRALSPGGFLSMEHQVYMPRLVSEVIMGLRSVGVEEPRDHFAVYNLPSLRRNLLLVSKRPLTDEVRNLAYGELTPERHGTIHLLYPAADSLADNLINRVVTDGWEAWADSAAIDISPCSDDRPFVAQMGRWRNFDRDAFEGVNRYAEFRGFPMSGITIAVILLVVVVLIVPLNLLPYIGRGEKLGAFPWMYFFSIGMAFMAVEVVLIQRYTLFIGASMYSIAAVLLTLLVAGGVGSRFSARVPDAVAFAGIIVMLALEILVFRRLTNALPHLEMLPRVLVSAALVFPLGFFMGMPFPKAVLRVRELVDWGFAVNGAASVFGATAVVLVAFDHGFTVALLCAAGIYLLAYGLFSARRRWPAR